MILKTIRSMGTMKKIFLNTMSYFVKGVHYGGQKLTDELVASNNKVRL